MSTGWFIGVYLSLGYAVLHQDKKQEAANHFKEALALCRELDYKISVVHCLAGFAAVAAVQGNGQESALLFGAADSQFQALLAEGKDPNSLMDPIDQKEFEYYQALCHSELGTDKYEEAMEQGRKMNLEQAIEYALEHVDE